MLPLCQSGPGTDGNEGVLRIPQIFYIGVLPSDCLVSYPGPSAEKQSIYSTAFADWARERGGKNPFSNTHGLAELD